jgi:hypothetical protein
MCGLSIIFSCMSVHLGQGMGEDLFRTGVDMGFTLSNSLLPLSHPRALSTRFLSLSSHSITHSLTHSLPLSLSLCFSFASSIYLCFSPTSYYYICVSILYYTFSHTIPSIHPSCVGECVRAPLCAGMFCCHKTLAVSRSVCLIASPYTCMCLRMHTKLW